eukprot:UN03976
MDGYNDFRTVLNEKHRENKQNDGDSKDEHIYDEKSYPRGKRFGIFFDRRKSMKKDEQNEVTFFEQLSKCDTIPRNHVAEWFMEAVRECLIPGDNKNKAI